MTPKCRHLREDMGSVDLPLPSCAIAVHSVPTTSSTNVDSVVNGNVQYHVARQRKVRKLEELDGIVVWPGAAAQCLIKTFLGVHRHLFDVEEEGENVVVHFVGFTQVRVQTLGASRRVAMDPQQYFSASSLVARVRRMWRPVFVRVLFNLWNCR